MNRTLLYVFKILIIFLEFVIVKQKFDIPFPEQNQVLEQKDIPIPIINVQRINASSIRTTWYLDRPIPTEAFIAMYEIHVRGQVFPDKIASDQM